MHIAFGPIAPEFGSWSWIGADLADALSDRHDVETFTNEAPVAETIVFVKFKPALDELHALSRHCTLVFCPVDIYGSAAEIDADWRSLRQCDLIVTHCERLGKYLAAYAPTRYLDHHLKFVAPLEPSRPNGGPILWIGNQSNLPPLNAWLSRHALPGELWVLTDMPAGAGTVSATDLGIPRHVKGRTARWTAERHIEWTALARGAIEVKGSDFRARHKSPAKAHDFIASGLPIAVNREAAAVTFLRDRGFEVADPTEPDRWLSEPYWRATQAYGARLRAELSLQQVAARLESLLDEARQRHLRRAGVT